MKSSITSHDRYPITHNMTPKPDSYTNNSNSNSKWKFDEKYNYPAKTN